MKEEHALLCLGSNTPDALRRLADARELLGGLGVTERETPVYESDPEYAGETVPYCNQLIWMSVEIGFDAFEKATKSYQSRIRAIASAAPLVAIDIDIVEWNGTVLRPKDAQSAYFRKGLSLVNT